MSFSPGLVDPPLQSSMAIHEFSSASTCLNGTIPAGDVSTKISVIRLSLLEVKLLSENNRLRCARISIRADSLVPLVKG